jgi:hypothetical protein
MHKLLHFAVVLVLVALGAKVLFGVALGKAILGAVFLAIIAAIAL